MRRYDARAIDNSMDDGRCDSGCHRARTRANLGAGRVELGEARVREEARELVDASRHGGQVGKRCERCEVDVSLRVQEALQVSVLGKVRRREVVLYLLDERDLCGNQPVS